MRVYRKDSGHEQAMKPLQSPVSDKVAVDSVSEKALKGRALSHSVASVLHKLNTMPVADQNLALIDKRRLMPHDISIPIDGNENPLAVYRFRYCSKGFIVLVLTIEYRISLTVYRNLDKPMYYAQPADS